MHHHTAALGLFSSSRILAAASSSSPVLLRHHLTRRSLSSSFHDGRGGDPDGSQTVAPILEEVQENARVDREEKPAVKINWDDRLQLQNFWNNEQKGWLTAVEWKKTPEYGVGLFSLEDVPAHSILRTGILNRNLKQFATEDDILSWCTNIKDQLDDARLRYVKDYLWGFYCSKTDERGYVTEATTITDEDGIYGMWVPGNGLNHSNEPNTVYRKTDQGIDLVALTDIQAGDELFDDYRRHGSAPGWLKQFATTHGVTLNFADCNDFVNTTAPGNDDRPT